MQTQMTVGYILENVLALLLCIALIFMRRRALPNSSSSTKRWAYIISRAYDSFWNCAVFLTFSVQIAAIVALVRVDFGHSAVGMGAITKETTWTVSLLTLIPLVHAAFFSNPSFFDTSKRDDASCTQEENDVLNEERKDNPPNPERKSSQFVVYQEREDRVLPQSRLVLFFICWFLSIYPFVTSMLSKFGSSQIGSTVDDIPGVTSGIIISTEDWNTIESICWNDVQDLSSGEQTAMTCFAILSWLFMTLLTFGRIIVSTVRDIHEKSSFCRLLDRLTKWEEAQSFKLFQHGLLVILTFLSVTQLWTYFRLHQLQLELAKINKGNDDDNQWMFGQVVAVAVFVPVLVDFILRIRITR